MKVLILDSEFEFSEVTRMEVQNAYIVAYRTFDGYEVIKNRLTGVIGEMCDSEFMEMMDEL